MRASSSKPDRSNSRYGAATDRTGASSGSAVRRAEKRGCSSPGGTLPSAKKWRPRRTCRSTSRRKKPSDPLEPDRARLDDRGRAPGLQKIIQHLGGVARLPSGYQSFQRSLHDDSSTSFAAFGSEIDD